MVQVLKNIADLIGQDNLREAIHQLSVLLKDSPRLDEAILQSARYSHIAREIRIGTIASEDASIAQNQIRAACLDLLRDIEHIQEERADIQAEIEEFAQKSDYDRFLSDVQQYRHNQNSTTSMPLIGKTETVLDSKSVERLLGSPKVRTHFDTHQIEDGLPLVDKLKSLNLMTNGYVLKGTFLCLSSVEQIRTVSLNAYLSKFFTFEDLRGHRTAITEFVAGNLVEQFSQMLRHIKRNLYLVRDIGTRTDDYEIPEEVFTELLANAYIHRNYDPDVLTDVKVEIYPDRMEITNPGKFPDIIDLNDLDNNDKSQIVNPEIVQIFYLHEIVETAAKGISRSQALLKKHRLPPAVFEQKKGYVKVTISKQKLPWLPDRLEKAHQFLDTHKLPDFFAYLRTEIGQHPLLDNLQGAYIAGASGASFEARLRSFADMVLREHE